MSVRGGDRRRGGRAKDRVLLVHGIWTKGLVMAPLARRLRAAGFEARTFSYSSLRESPAESAERLADALRSAGSRPTHVVAHSLGGVVVLHLAARGGLPPAGRVVFLGVPARGSAAARVLASRALTRPLLGRGGRGGLVGRAPRWPGGRDLGLVSGTKPYGVGRLLLRLPSPNDGTVAVAETRVAGATASISLAASHTGLLVSGAVAEAVAAFLRTGRFPPEPGA